MSAGTGPVEIVVPKENVNDESATLVAWTVAPGVRVEAGQGIAQIETSKAVVDVNAPASGFLRTKARQGDDVPIGGILGWIDATADAPAMTGKVPGPEPVPAARLNGESAGFPPSVRRIVAEEGLDPASIKGTGRGGRVTKGDVLSHLNISPEPERGPLPTRISRKAAEEIRRLGLNEDDFAGHGLVRTRDLSPKPAPTPNALPSTIASARAPASPSKPVPAAGVPVRVEELSRAKRTEAKYLRSGTETTLASVVTVTCPTRGLRAAAGRLPAIAGNATALVVYETARLLKKYPALNAYHDDGKACLYDEVNIGFAIDAGRGLKVAVVPWADRKGVAEIADAMRELVVAYLDDTLPVAALAGGTFTLTDLSGEGVTAFHPLINRGQSAILGVGAEVFPGGGRDGWFNLILAFDHQLAEGRSAAKFLGELRDRLAHYETAVPGGVVTSDVAPPRCARCGSGVGDPSEGQVLVQTVGADGSTRLLCKLCFQGWT